MYDSITTFFWTSAALVGVVMLVGIIALKRMVCRMHAQRKTFRASKGPEPKKVRGRYREIKVNGTTYYSRK